MNTSDLLLISLAFALMSCSQQIDPIMTPKSDSTQFVSVSPQGTYAFASKKERSEALIRSTFKPFEADGEPLFIVSVLNKSPQPVRFDESNLSFLVNGKEASIPTKDEKLSSIRSKSSGNIGKKVGKSLLVGIASGLANTSTSTTTYTTSGGYSGNFTTTSVNHYGASQMNAEAASRIEAEFQHEQQNLEELQMAVARAYFKPFTIPPDRTYTFAISADAKNRQSELTFIINFLGEAHRFNFSLK
jgi:hypothetical protein